MYGRFQRGFPDKGNSTQGFYKQAICWMLAVLVTAAIAVSIAVSIKYGTVQSPAPAATTTNYGASVTFEAPFDNQLLNPDSSAFRNTEASTCQQMEKIFRGYLTNYYKSCGVVSFGQGSIIANFRFVFDFGAVDSTDSSRLIRETIQDGARNTAGLNYSINANTVTVNAEWSSGQPNVCERNKPCDHICRPLEGASYVCSCSSGFRQEGNKCIAPDACSSRPCFNYGDCVAIGDSNYTCVCPAPYTGKDCRQVINNCASNPCQNGATCWNGLDGFMCKCASSYTGLLCETPILYECTNTSCANNGTCMADLTGNFTCACECGFSGIICQTDIDECASSPCLNAATCVDRVNGYACQCNSSFVGQHCELNANTCASNPCQNGGTCWNGVNMFTCQCSITHTGAMCETLLPEIFCAALTSNRSLSYGTIKDYEVITAQRRQTFNAASGRYNPISNGTYVLHMSAGTQGSTYSGLYIEWSGGSAELEARSDTTPNGIETSSRDYIAQFQASDNFFMTLEGDVYNDQMMQTSMSAFRLEDAMTTVIAFATAYDGSSNPPLGTTLIFDSVDVNVGLPYNPSTGAFVAPQDGVYVISVSILATTSYKSTVGLNINGVKTYEMIMNATHNDDDYPFGRSVALQLTAGTNVTLSLLADRLYGNSGDKETSFIGWLYNPKPGTPSVIWSVHRTTSLTGANSPVTFDSTDLSIGNAWNASTSIVTIPASGIYQIHMTATCAINGALNFQLMWNGAPYANIYSTSSNLDGIVMKTRAIMVDATAGDTLYIATDSTTSLFSNSMKLISFTGFLLVP